MNELLKSMKWGMMLTGLLTIIIGIMICANPSGAIISIIRFIGWVLIIAGGVSAIGEFMQRTTTYRTYSTMTFALISLVFGIVLAICKFCWNCSCLDFVCTWNKCNSFSA